MIRRLFAIALALIGLSFSQEIEKLLEEYKEASELYKKTRKESLGHLIIFTREDLERMQAYKLSDVLKSVRFFTWINNRFGVSSLSEYGGLNPIPRSIRLYINDHEVSSIHTGSPFLVWENFPLDVVDHIEIYVGAGAIELGNDPAALIVKIYTKEPRKENATYVRGLISSRKGYGGVIYSAEELTSDLSYIFLFTDGADNRKDYRIGNQELSRDARYNYAFLGLYFERTSLELGYGLLKRSPFMGFAVDGVAEEGKTEAQDFYVSLTSYPLKDRSVKLVLSFDNHSRKHYEKSSTGLYIPAFSDPSIKDFYDKGFFHKMDLYLSKEFKTEKNKLLTAVSYKAYSSDIDSRYYTRFSGERVRVEDRIPFDRQEIYSLILEDQFSINPKNLLIAGVKFDKYHRNGGFKDFDRSIIRAGYITLLKRNVVFKGFVSRSYIPPFFYDVEISGRDLDPVEIPLYLSTELIIGQENLKLSLGGGYVKIEDFFVPDRSGRLKNSGEALEIKPLFTRVDYRLGKTDVSIGYSALVDPERKLSPTRGGFFRIMSSYGRLDTFAELVYRGPYEFLGKKVEEGYDLSAGLSYRITKGIALHIKGENLLNEATKTPYLWGSEVVNFPVTERTIYIGTSVVF